MDFVYGPCFLMPDLGDVLGEESLAEHLDATYFYTPLRMSEDGGPIAMEEVELDQEDEYISTRRSVYLHSITDVKKLRFMALSPPPTHLCLNYYMSGAGDQGGRVLERLVDESESLQHWLSSTHLTYLQLSYMDEAGEKEELLTFLLNMLHNLPPNSHLRTLEFDFKIDSETQIEDILGALSSSSCSQVEHLSLCCADSSLLFTNPRSYTCKLGRRCRSLCLAFHKLGAADISFSDLMSSPECQLQYLQLIMGLDQSNPYNSFKYCVGALISELHSCKLKRLDISEGPSLELEGMRLLLHSISSPSCCIHDLGLSLSSLPHLSKEENKARHSMLAQEFRSGTSLSKLIALRVGGIDTDEAAACVVDILGCPESNCKVRFLQMQFSESYGHAAEEPFFKKLLHLQVINRPPRIQCLRAYFAHGDQEVSELPSLAEFLTSENCSLLWLQCQRVPGDSNNIPESMQMKIANALEPNHLITSLEISSLTSPAARSRSAAFLARNRRYKSMGFSKEEHRTQPHVARLFLCGHGEVGKTTLWNALRKLHYNKRLHSTPSSSAIPIISCRPSAACARSFNKLHRRMCLCSTSSTRFSLAADREPARTRGLEIQHLSFEPAKKLAIFDLAGQPDYHVFHHYFMTNTSHDLFIVLCKYTISTRDSQLASELEYWLRFIVSHRNSVHGPNPRILLVVNFFHAAVPAGSHSSLQYDMQDKAEDLTKSLRRKYAGQLDFGGHQLNADNVFGIVALNTIEAEPILKKLEILLADLLKLKPMIPKLCHDVSHTLYQLTHHVPSQKIQFTCAGMQGIWHFLHHIGAGGKRSDPAKKVLVGYTEVKDQIIIQQVSSNNMLEKRLVAALVELHNVGEVVFFPPLTANSKQAELTSKLQAIPINSQSIEVHRRTSASSQMITEAGAPVSVITDPNWFCNKVVGNLLAPEAFSGKSEWNDMDVRQVLMENGCPSQYVDGVLQYIQSLELCFRFYSSASGSWKFFFPAVATDRALHWPPIFKKQFVGNAAGDYKSMQYFYGRRIRCKDSERHLIPSGVFARLQVKLQTFCGVGNERSFMLGYHWASFLRDNIGVMVSFGRVDVAATDTSTASSLSTHMKEDDHPEWIDILLCLPSSQEYTQQEAATTASAKPTSIMSDIKTLIFDICQATSRGIPTVVLEECVLRNEARQGVMPLEEIEACIHTKGLPSSISWEDQESTPVVDLLLPEEIQRHIVSHVQAIQQIEAEYFGLTTQDGDEEEGRLLSDEPHIKMGECDQQLLYQGLSSEFKVLHDLLISKLDRLGVKLDTNCKWLGAKMENVVALVKEIKQDVHKVMQGLRQAEVAILAKCSTGLLTQLLVQGVLPAYPYLTNSKGRMQKLKNVVLHKKATVHFLCESVTEGPHEVEGQVGKEVVMEKGILLKMAPFLVPTLMVLCCAASFVANANLPGVAPFFFDPLCDYLRSLNIKEEDLKSQVLPKLALGALFEDLGSTAGKVRQYDDIKGALLNIDEEQIKEGKEALERILGSIRGLDMEHDFGLSLVQVGKEANHASKATWLCKHHAKAHRKLIPQPLNPFTRIPK